MENVGKVCPLGAVPRMCTLAPRPAVIAKWESRSATCMTLPLAVIGPSSLPQKTFYGDPRKIPAVGPCGQRIQQPPLPGELEFDVMVRKWPPMGMDTYVVIKRRVLLLFSTISGI